jgi:MADS-box transcription factor
MKGEDINSLQPKELIAIEEALQNGQTNLREKMVIWGFSLSGFRALMG